jgi:hypothetical protein
VTKLWPECCEDRADLYRAACWAPAGSWWLAGSTMCTMHYRSMGAPPPGAIAGGDRRAGGAANRLPVAKVADRAAAGHHRACAGAEGDGVDGAGHACRRAHLWASASRGVSKPRSQQAAASAHFRPAVFRGRGSTESGWRTARSSCRLLSGADGAAAGLASGAGSYAAA